MPTWRAIQKARNNCHKKHTNTIYPKVQNIEHFHEKIKNLGQTFGNISRQINSPRDFWMTWKLQKKLHFLIFFLNEKVGGPGPPGPLGCYGTVYENWKLYYNFITFYKMLCTTSWQHIIILFTFLLTSVHSPPVCLHWNKILIGQFIICCTENGKKFISFQLYFCSAERKIFWRSN